MGLPGVTHRSPVGHRCVTRESPASRLLVAHRPTMGRPWVAYENRVKIQLFRVLSPILCDFMARHVNPHVMA